MVEEWKIIEGSDGLFSVSNYGRIRQNHYEYISLLGHKIIKEEKIIQPSTWQSRYLRVDIQNCRKDKRFRKAVYIHKLVAEYFIGPRPEGYVIDHIDGNYLNNRADNLRYVTQKQNLNNPNTKGKAKEALQKIWSDPLLRKEYSNKISEGTKRAMKEKGCSDIISKANKNRTPMFKGNAYKRPKPEEVQFYLDNGWQFGFPESTRLKLKARHKLNNRS